MEPALGHWYRRDVDVALDDLRTLTPEERGIYDTVMLLIHRRGGAVPDDDGFVAGWCNCEPRVWRRVRARLIALEKLYAADDGLRSPLADPEVAETKRRHADAQAAGRASARKRMAGSNEINGLGSTPAAAEAPIIPEEPEGSDEAPFARAAAEARAGIDAHLDDMTPSDAEELVAGLLQAQGYVTEVARPGPDGGTDILAYRDPLGPASLRAQVKHWTAPVRREDVAALRGILHPGETGLFVSFSTFTREAEREAQGGVPVRLIDRDAFIALWIRHYETLPDAARDRMRLKAVHFLDRGRNAREDAIAQWTCTAEREPSP
jgi:uncharacterized protein YdaU (DUF1376 family)